MLEHVALNQTRFNTPGVAPDSRGILLGKQGALLFSSIDRLVAFFRVFCEEASMDDLYPKLRIEQLKSTLESREFAVFFHATTSYLCDRVSRLALMVGGFSFTGSGKHYVKYRDGGSPLGYDTHSLSTEVADYLFYAETFVQAHTRIKEVPFQQLIFRLSPRALPGFSRHAKSDALPDAVTREGELDTVFMTARLGLSRSLLTYLWRNRVRAAATVIDPEISTAIEKRLGSAFSTENALLLVKVSQLPERMLRLFLRVPGIELYRPVTEQCAIELGFFHPIRLESCSAIFDTTKFYLFSGHRDSVDVMSAPTLVPAQDLIGGGFNLAELSEPRTMNAAVAPERMDVPLKLVFAESARRRVTATLVPWAQAGWLKRLVYALPPTMLSSLRVQAIEDGLFIIGDRGIDGLPIGAFFQEAAPAIYVPLGHEFLPRVSAEVLTDHVGGVTARSVIFRLGRAPMAVAEAAFEPLSRHVLSRLPVETRLADPRLPAPPSATPATVVNEDAGVLPLWSFRPDPLQ